MIRVSALRSAVHKSSNIFLFFQIFKDWRKHVFGAIDDPRIRFLNTIEYPWYDDLMYRKDWVACDQIVMAVYLDESIVTSRQNYWVIYL